MAFSETETLIVSREWLKPGTHWLQSRIRHVDFVESRKSRPCRFGPVHTGNIDTGDSRKDIRHSGDKNYPLSTKLKMFNFGDNVDRDRIDKVERAGDSRLSTNQRQIGNKVESIGDKVDSRLCRRFVDGVGNSVDFVASVYRT